MLKSVELLLNGEVHAVHFMQESEPGKDDRLAFYLACPKCGHMGKIDGAMVNGRVSIQCENTIQESFGQKSCNFHETHDYLGMAAKQIKALLDFTKDAK